MPPRPSSRKRPRDASDGEDCVLVHFTTPVPSSTMHYTTLVPSPRADAPVIFKVNQLPKCMGPYIKARVSSGLRKSIVGLDAEHVLDGAHPTGLPDWRPIDVRKFFAGIAKKQPHHSFGFRGEPFVGKIVYSFAMLTSVGR